MFAYLVSSFKIACKIYIRKSLTKRIKLKYNIDIKICNWVNGLISKRSATKMCNIEDEDVYLTLTKAKR